MKITPQQQRVPLVDLDTGLIRREWISVLTAAEQTSGEVDLAALDNLVALLDSRLSNLETTVAVLTARVIALEAVPQGELVLQAAALPPATDVVLQPSPPGGADDVILQPCCGMAALDEMVVQP